MIVSCDRRRTMATVDDYEKVVAAVAQAASGDLDLVAVGVGRTEAGGLQVNLATREPGQLIGRRGATADAIRAALAERFGLSEAQLNVHQVPPV